MKRCAGYLFKRTKPLTSMNEQKELKLKNYLYKILHELTYSPLNTVNKELVEFHLKSMTDDMFAYIEDTVK